MRKWLFVISGLIGLSLFAYVYAHNVPGVDPVYDKGVNLPAGAVGGISFHGKGITVIDENGKKIKPVKETRKGVERSMATVSIIKVNPCYVKWCPSGSECEYYKISEGACPAWW